MFTRALALLLLPAAPLLAQDPVLSARVEARIQSTAGDAVDVSVFAIESTSGRVVLARNPGRLMHPASTLKVVTAAAFLVAGGGGGEVVTTLRGPDPDGTLWLVGAGDPLLSTADLERLAISAPGAIGVDASLFAGPRFGTGWMWDDEPGAFMPHLSALSVDGAAIRVRVVGDPAGARAEIEPPGEHVSVELAVEVRPDAPADGEGVEIDRDWMERGRTVRATGMVRPGDSAEARLSVPDPALAAGRALRAMRLARGTPCGEVRSGVAPAGLPVLAKVVRSDTAILARSLKDSDNLSAECLLRLLAVRAGKTPATAEDGLALVRAHLASLGQGEGRHRIVDGCGMSHYDLVSARLLVQVLRDVEGREGARATLREALPIAGTDGTLARRFRDGPAAGRVRAKTGTISGASALAGRFERPGREPILFAVLVQNYVGPAGPWRDLLDAIVLEIVEAER